MKVCENDASHVVDADAEKSGFCSDCGGALIDPSQQAPVAPAAPAASPSVASAPTGELCPDCGTPREGTDKFCQCGYDFESKTSAAVPDPSQAAAQPAPGSTWVVTLTYDLTSARSFRPSDAELAATGVTPPTDVNPREFILTGDVVPFSRASNVIPVNDRGVSRKEHGEFVKQPDGSYAVKDAGTTADLLRGVYVNNDANSSRLGVNETQVLTAGDKVLVGCWAVLTITKR